MLSVIGNLGVDVTNWYWSPSMQIQKLHNLLWYGILVEN